MIQAIKRFMLKSKPSITISNNEVFKGIEIKGNKIDIDVSTIRERGKTEKKRIWVSPDFFKEPHIVGDTRNLAFLKDNSVDSILADKTITDFKREEYQDALNHWRRILKPKGMLHIIVPDIIDTAIRFRKGEIKQSSAIIEAVYGSKDSISYNGFWFSRLERALREAKFTKVVLASEKKLKDKTLIYVKAVK